MPENAAITSSTLLLNGSAAWSAATVVTATISPVAFGIHIDGDPTDIGVDERGGCEAIWLHGGARLSLRTRMNVRVQIVLYANTPQRNSQRRSVPSCMLSGYCTDVRKEKGYRAAALHTTHR